MALPSGCSYLHIGPSLHPHPSLHPSPSPHPHCLNCSHSHWNENLIATLYIWPWFQLRRVLRLDRFDLSLQLQLQLFGVFRVAVVMTFKPVFSIGAIITLYAMIVFFAELKTIINFA